MPRVDNNRGISIPYRPGNPAGPDASLQEALRAVWDELNRISIATAAIDEPVSTGAQVSGTVNVTQEPPVYTRIFNSGFLVDPWVNPDDSFDVLTGIYTVPQEGVYSVQAQATISEHSTPQNKNYWAGLRMTLTPPGGAPVQYFSYAGGPDDVPLTVTGLFTQQAQKGAQIYFDLAAVHEQTTGPETYGATLQVIRISGTGNNVA